MRKRPLPGQRRKPVQRERREQSDILKVLAPVSDKVYVLGTTRMPKCSNCGQVLARAHFSTRQTPGISDVYAMLKKPTYRREPGIVGESREFHADPPFFIPAPTAVWVEVKAGKNKPTADQEEFAALCAARGIAHVTGGVNAVIGFLVAGGWLKIENVPHYRLPGPFFQAPSGHGR